MRPVIVSSLIALVACHYDRPRSSANVTALRAALLNGLDQYVPPSTDGQTGVEIGIQYRFFKVIRVDMASGQLVLKVWRRMRWKDERLSWDPNMWGGLTQVIIYPNAAYPNPDANMWTPQIVLYNGITPQEQVMEDGAAWVNHDGAVWQSVPGVVDVTCRFAGLTNFPRDTLSCPIEIASWSYSDLVTNLTFMMDRDCVDLTPDNPTAGTTYQEYLLTHADCQRNTRFYPCCGDTPYSQLIVRLFMKRSSLSYILMIEVCSQWAVPLLSPILFLTLMKQSALAPSRLSNPLSSRILTGARHHAHLPLLRRALDGLHKLRRAAQPGRDHAAGHSAADDHRGR